VLERLEISTFPRACRICACSDKRNPDIHASTLDMVTHLCLTCARMSTHAKTATISLATSIRIRRYCVSHGGLEFVFTNRSSHWILRGVNPVTIVLVKDIQLSEIGVLYPRLLQSERPQHALVSVLVFQTQSEIAGYERMKLMDPTGVYTGGEAQFHWLNFRIEKRESTALRRKPHRMRTPEKNPTLPQLQ
jgi:hypothetical protein